MVITLVQNLFTTKETKIPLMKTSDVEKVKERILHKVSSPLAIHADEQEIIKEIKNETFLKNANNVTRTKAYLDFYCSHPEIHWAFLAHMVSRNAGYHMTDLKGELLPSIIERKEAENFFLFLERANAYIFHDAYPQLLLYHQSIKKKKPLFHLLPAFGVSRAMSVFWERFWQEREPVELSLTLIINEQNMLQKRLLSNLDEGYLQEKLLFLLQDRLELTTVFFPYIKKLKIKQTYSLAGTSVSHFEDPQKRIEIGKRLYSILFLKKTVKQSSLEFAVNTHHTGSRSDYWPDSYSSSPTDCKRIFSPLLKSVWKNVPHTFFSEDWVNERTLRDLDILKAISIPKHFDVTLQAKVIVKFSAKLKNLSTRTRLPV
ncbi:DUF2515 domain-containing protein [Rossellomorea vietnamensis]|uniref:DUF2515 domain-containing protein n=1 Tax=Rossellomorea vietnamensis TaxID=218284 RepID=A0A5D4MIQ0_9BACI|nr:DUF2515 family protein [Rossellomorea vietnamensis]TYS01613.1 DUF2515 domain-containing protein [Rossellomorea vietnamensis]